MAVIEHKYTRAEAEKLAPNLVRALGDPNSSPEKRQSALNTIRKIFVDVPGATGIFQPNLASYGMSTDEWGNISFQKNGKLTGAYSPNTPIPNGPIASNLGPNNGPRSVGGAPQWEPDNNHVTGSTRLFTGASGDGRNIGGLSNNSINNGVSGKPVDRIMSDNSLPGGVNSGIANAGIPGTQGGGGGGGGGDGSGAATGDPSLQTFDMSKFPDDAYFKGAQGGTLNQITPDFMAGDAQNNAAWQYYINSADGGKLRDTYANDYLQDDFKSADMVNRLLGGNAIDATLDAPDRMYATQQLMSKLSSGGNYISPTKMLDAMFAKVGQIEDPQMQMNYIQGTLAAIKPYMTPADYAGLQAKVGRQADNLFVQGINDPNGTSDKDFLGMLKGMY